MVTVLTVTVLTVLNMRGYANVTVWLCCARPKGVPELASTTGSKVIDVRQLNIRFGPFLTAFF